MVIWSLATVREHGNDHLFFNIAANMEKSVHSANSQEMTRIVSSFSNLGVCPNQLFNLIAEKAVRSLKEFRSEDLFQLLWGFCVSSFWYEDIFIRAAGAVQSQIPGLHAAKLFAAMSLARPRHPTTRAVLRVLLPYCVVASFTPEELSKVMLAVARCFGKSTATSELAEIQSVAGASPTWGDSEVSITSTPLQVSKFMQECLRQIPAYANLNALSTQTMADMSWSLVAMQLEGKQDLLPLLGKEALVRRTDLDTPALLTLLRCLLTVPTQACSIAVRLFFAEAGRRVKHLAFDERQRLACLCAEAEPAEKRGTAECKELEMRCQNLSKVYSPAQRGDPQPLQNSDEVLPQTAAHNRFNDAYQAFRSMDLIGMPAVSQFSIAEGEIEEEQAKEEAPARRAGSKQLPPPLDFVPRYISLDSLQLYREEYQRFRTGDASGAKGEMSSQVTRKNDQEESKEIKRLPPPLDFIPSDISREKLEAYRRDYQDFRAGRATGAKGEVQKAVEKDEPLFISLDNLVSVGQQNSVAPAPLRWPGDGRGRGSLGRDRWSASSASSQLHEAMEDLPEPPARTMGRHLVRAASPGTGSEDEGAWPDSKLTSWDSKADMLSDTARLPIKNTFLHFQEASPEDEEDDPDEEENEAKLPPPLLFLPSTVSADKLKAYRLDYQKFRTGKSSGAKGEVSESVAD